MSKVDVNAIKTWYGPHACDECGAEIIKTSLEEGGHMFDVPARLMRVYHRGSEAGSVDVVYPQTWTPHVHVDRSQRPSALADDCDTTSQRLSQPIGLTTDPNDPRLTHYTGPEKPAPQAEMYLVLSDEELSKGFVRPFRDKYRHLTCGSITSMGEKLSATYARNPKFYGATYCVECCAHFPVSEFVWTKDGLTVGS